MNRVIGWITGTLVALGLAALALRYYVPPLPAALDLSITFAEKNLTEGEPLAVTGEPGSGDFLHVKFLGPRTIAFGYDRWGSGGPVSAPIAIRPGVAYALRIESPSLANVRSAPTRGPEKLRVTFNGARVLESPALFTLRQPSRAWLAENPIGGSSCGPRFSGELVSESGWPVRGNARHAFSPREKFAAWLTVGRWQVLGILLLGFGAGWAASRVTGMSRDDWQAFRQKYRAGPQRWFITAVAPCVIVFSWLITDGTGTFGYPEAFGNFYDYQAASLFQGHLDVPQDAISGEAFIVAGKFYGYFGITPALLRLPFVIFDLEFGCLSRALMLGYYVACLTAAYLLLRHATKKLRGPDARPTPMATVLLIWSAGLGSTLLFLGARAYIYHEAILCGAAFSLWTIWFAVRWLEAPGSRAWLGALGCGTLAVHARPTPGLFSLTVLGCAALAVALATKRLPRPLGVALLAFAALVSFNGLSYLKFGTFDGSPFKYSVQYNAERRAKFGDQNFHLVNLRHNLDCYLLRADFRFERNFPWFYGGDRRSHYYAESKIDLAEMAIGMPYVMPALFALAVVGGAWAFWREPALRTPLAVVCLGVMPMALALLTAIVTSHRYTGDFCPWLIASAAFAVAFFDATHGWHRRIFVGITTLLAAVSIAATFAIALHFQGEIWGVPDATQKNYQHLRQRVDKFFGVPPRPAK